MSTDWYSRLMLTVIAAALVALAAERWQHPSAPAGEGRFRLTPIPMARMAIRFNSETGETWAAMFPDLRIWNRIAETPAEVIDRPASPATSPVPPPEFQFQERPAPAPAPPGPGAEPGEPAQP